MNEELSSKFEALLREISGNLNSVNEELFVDRIKELKKLEAEHLKVQRDNQTLKDAIRVMCSDV